MLDGNLDVVFYLSFLDLDGQRFGESAVEDTDCCVEVGDVCTDCVEVRDDG